MNGKEFAKYLARDNGRCIHCGTEETLVPHHRLNRGMGGAKSRDLPANIVVICAGLNFLLEADPDIAGLGRRYGWKLKTGQSPDLTPLWDASAGVWVLLDNGFGRNIIGGSADS